MTKLRFNCSQQHNANLWCAESSAISKQDRLLLKWAIGAKHLLATWSFLWKYNTNYGRKDPKI